MTTRKGCSYKQDWPEPPALDLRRAVTTQALHWETERTARRVLGARVHPLTTGIIWAEMTACESRKPRARRREGGDVGAVRGALDAMRELSTCITTQIPGSILVTVRGGWGC